MQRSPCSPKRRSVDGQNNHRALTTGNGEHLLRKFIDRAYKRGVARAHGLNEVTLNDYRHDLNRDRRLGG